MVRWMPVAAATLCGLLGAGGAMAQQCPNQQVGPLIGTSSEFCLTGQEIATVDFSQPVFTTTAIGPVTTVTFNRRGTVAHVRWINPTCQPMPCEQAAQQPNDPNAPPNDGSSSAGFSMGSAQGCSGIVTAEMCLSLSQGGVNLMTQRVAACPVPPMPPGGGGGATSVNVTCPCPVVPPIIPECTSIVVPVTANVSGTTNFIDCTDSANWTDLNGAPQSKPCFNARQRCTSGTISGPVICESQNAVVTPVFGCMWGPTIVVTLVPNSPGVVIPDDPGDGFDPPRDGQSEGGDPGGNPFEPGPEED